MNSITLSFTLLSDWHISSGDEAGTYADATVIKDNQGLPYLPGKAIKGLLRQAFTIAADNQWFTELTTNSVNTLFGQEGAANTQQGLVQISSAHLATDEANYIVENNAHHYLTKRVHQMAINKQTGVTQKGSLRAIEVAVPMTLHAQINLNSSHPEWDKMTSLQTQFTDWLDQSLPLITELGAKRQRGLGQVQVTLATAQQEAC